MKDLKNDIKSIGKHLGFDEVGIAGVDKFKTDQLAAKDRVRNGLIDGLSWFTEDRVMLANTPEELLPGCKSIISVAISYYKNAETYADGKLRGKVARYAWGMDYHDVIKKRLKLFIHCLKVFFNNQAWKKTSFNLLSSLATAKRIMLED